MLSLFLWQEKKKQTCFQHNNVIILYDNLSFFECQKQTSDANLDINQSSAEVLYLFFWKWMLANFVGVALKIRDSLLEKFKALIEIPQIWNCILSKKFESICLRLSDMLSLKNDYNFKISFKYDMGIMICIVLNKNKTKSLRKCTLPPLISLSSVLVALGILLRKTNLVLPPFQ